MNKSTLLMIAMLALIVGGSACAKGPVWKVSKGDQRIYLGGTIHVLSESDYPLPEAFEAAYKVADTLVFETDIAAMSNPATQLQLLQVMTFQDGRTLQSVLSPDSLSALEAFLSERGLPISNFSRFTPAGISLTLTALELQRLGLGVSSGVDQFFNSRAMNDGKAIEALETIEEQMGFINGLNQSDGDALIQSTLKDVAGLSQLWQSMLAAWRSADMEALEVLALKPMQSEFPAMTKLLLDQRNENWLADFPAMFADEDVEFVLVGSLHMVGKNGLLARLRGDGYSVEALK